MLHPVGATFIIPKSRGGSGSMATRSTISVTLRRAGAERPQVSDRSAGRVGKSLAVELARVEFQFRVIFSTMWKLSEDWD